MKNSKSIFPGDERYLLKEEIALGSDYEECKVIDEWLDILECPEEERSDVYCRINGIDYMYYSIYVKMLDIESIEFNYWDLEKEGVTNRTEMEVYLMRDLSHCYDSIHIEVLSDEGQMILSEYEKLYGECYIEKYIKECRENTKSMFVLKYL